MKYFVLIPDGAADQAMPELDGRTPLESAFLPHFDAIARHGELGLANFAPAHMFPGSDVACMGLLGYDPARNHTGRAPLEAASLGVDLQPDEIAVRCNLVSVENGNMQSFSADHIPTADAHEIVKTLQENLGTPSVRFVAGVSYRHLVILKGVTLDCVCEPPHEIVGRPVAGLKPKPASAAGAAGADLLNLLMTESINRIARHPVTRARLAAGRHPPTQIWLWGYGPRPALPSFQSLYGLKGAMISAVDLLRSIGLYAGMDLIAVPGITGYTDTNYAGKGQYACAALKDHDLVVVHVEATDESSHEGNVAAKIKALEDIDEKILCPVMSWLQAHGDHRILVAPDHPTFCATRVHSKDPVPYAMGGKGINYTGAMGYNEPEARNQNRHVPDGYTLMRRLTGST